MIPPPVRLWLDHASITVPRLEPAVERMAHLGLVATVTPADPRRHSRVYLHRSYLEVAAIVGSTGWRVSHFFLRFDDRTALLAHLDGAGLTYQVSEYTGVDGRWDDVEVRHPPVPFPILVRRTHPPEVARDWPPPLSRPQPCGARVLEAVHVTTPDWAAAVAEYERLLGSVGGDERLERIGVTPRRRRFKLRSGSVVVSEGESPGVSGVVLGVESLHAAADAMGSALGSVDGDGVAWVQVPGLRLGLVEPPPA